MPPNPPSNSRLPRLAVWSGYGTGNYSLISRVYHLITHTSQLDIGDSFFTDRFSFNRLVRVEMYSASFRILRIRIEKVAGLDDVNCQSQSCLHDIVKALFQPGNFGVSHFVFISKQ